MTVGFRCLLCCGFATALAALCRRDQRLVFAVRGEYPAVPGQVYPRPGDQCSELGYEIHGLENHMSDGGPVVPSRYGVFNS
ncbi:MAG: hypothetical protein ACI9UN_005506 [Granulosicoccus sp.]|jgi:hypothetical protein